MSIVFGAIVPHGFPIIPDLSEDAEGGLATRAAMITFGERLAAAKPDVIVIATPHGVRAEGQVALAAVARGAGKLTWEGCTFEMNIPVDLAFTDAIAEKVRARGVPLAMIGFAGNRRDQSAVPLDWGVITPAYFAGHTNNVTGQGDVLAPKPATDIAPPVVVVNPSRQLPYESNLEFGRAVAEAASASGKRVAFIASCDWGHCHAQNGPYGYNPESQRVDDIVVDAIKRDDLKSLMSLTEKETTDAAIDGLWQTLMLDGALEGTGSTSDLLIYEHPSYYGMIVALYDVPATA
jgi:aromatic ring-opening dioxygenase LigB subunit